MEPVAFRLVVQYLNQLHNRNVCAKYLTVMLKCVGTYKNPLGFKGLKRRWKNSKYVDRVGEMCVCV